MGQPNPRGGDAVSVPITPAGRLRVEVAANVSGVVSLTYDEAEWLAAQLDAAEKFCRAVDRTALPERLQVLWDEWYHHYFHRNSQ